jgi:hypothetical protein
MVLRSYLATGEWLWTAREVLIVTKAFICPTNIHVNWFRNVKICIKNYNKCSYMFRFNKTIIREPTVCASLKLQYWRQLKYFVIELFARVATFYSVLLVCVSRTVQSETLLCTIICGHTTEEFNNEGQYCNFSEAQFVGSLMRV